MPVISSFYGIIIYIFFEDHNPPHFHAKYNEYEALVSIDSFGIIKGHLPGKAMALVVEWAIQHKEELMKDWDLAKQNKALNKIDPLK